VIDKPWWIMLGTSPINLFFYSPQNKPIILFLYYIPSFCIPQVPYLHYACIERARWMLLKIMSLHAQLAQKGIPQLVAPVLFTTILYTVQHCTCTKAN